MKVSRFGKLLFVLSQKSFPFWKTFAFAKILKFLDTANFFPKNFSQKFAFFFSPKIGQERKADFLLYRKVVFCLADCLAMPVERCKRRELCRTVT